MDENEILNRIKGLVDEEHQLRQPGETADGDRLQHVEEMLDQCWDLLRQRRAKREFGADPDQAKVRDIRTVESYEQ